MKNVQITKQDRFIRPDQDTDLKAYWNLCEKILSDVPKALDCENAHAVILKTEEADDLHIEYENFVLREVEKDSKSDSEILLEWLKAQYRKGNKKVLKSSINQKHAKFKSAKLRDAALQYLIETYHIRIETLNNRDYVVLHPELVENLSN